MVEAIENSPVPVIIYISPTGSRAGSAGFFLLEAADIAAMAPGTNAGASHPVAEGRQPDAVLKQKIENDAAAFLRSFVSRRGRNVQAAEDAVRNSKSYSDEEALNLKLIDLISPNDQALLATLDGRQIKRFDGSTATLHLHGATVTAVPPSVRERLLTRLTDPNLAVLLLVLGGLLIYLEFNVPGTIIPGSLGTLFVLLSLFGLNLLPIRHTAILLLIAAVVLMVLETKFASHGILALAGTVSLVFGLATLVNGPIPEMQVHTGTALGAGIGFGAISFGLAWIALRARRGKVLTGPQAMLGGIAIAQTPLSPNGQVADPRRALASLPARPRLAFPQAPRCSCAASKALPSSSNLPKIPSPPEGHRPANRGKLKAASVLVKSTIQGSLVSMLNVSRLSCVWSVLFCLLATLAGPTAKAQSTPPLPTNSPASTSASAESANSTAPAAASSRSMRSPQP